MSENKASRRAFLKTAALLGGSAAAASQVPGLLTRLGTAEANGYLTPQEQYPLAKPENILYSVCQQCNTQCGIKVKIEN
ncbi:MAG: twin-arginine translocation signal domain-containing protein, partial [candidate division NC10 bacterium]